MREREQRGSRDSRRLRRAGLVPGVLYGRGKTPHVFSVPERDLRAALTGSAGLHAILDVVLDGQKTTHASVLKEYQQDTLRGTITHVDLQEVRLDQAIHATVAVQLVGESVGVKAGGVLTQVTREINVEALPLEVPEHLELDVGAMEIGDSLRISDLAAQEGVTFLDDPETVLASVAVPKRVVEVEEVAEEAVEGEEAAEAEAEAAPAQAGAESAEAESPG